MMRIACSMFPQQWLQEDTRAGIQRALDLMYSVAVHWPIESMLEASGDQ